ncbi:MAG: serine/threonine protein kinase [Leptolyngbyaceae cyanobacterium SM1_3_5]|nr:serine/threonine protein kinase [Leptolyngbyaceae cyanobacterium SM1_3_5]
MSGRYRIAKVLGSGGFSETYVAEDIQRPGNPYCVVKQLRVISDDPNTLKLARRLFATEAETLERLGQHDQIPQLLASFEENNEFYLVQEFIQGHPLNHEILPKRSLPEAKIIQILTDLLEVLAFVHEQGVIHRDLKPANIMRRSRDSRLVLIDFGIARKITTQLAESGTETKYTVSVGTPGYMPSEQSSGRPQFNSDIYAIGMTAIYALTGKSPHTLIHDAETGAVRWRSQAVVSDEFAAILDRMVHHDFTQRYRSVHEVRVALLPLIRSRVAIELPIVSADDLLATEANTIAATADQFNLDDADNPIAANPIAANSIAATADRSDTVEADATIGLPEDWVNQ